tara:strand:+ start:3480 stop:4082 length:603 start_codon:yes stop_codon:yes gene_type:complete
MKTFKLKFILISTCTLLAATSFTDVLNRPKLTPTTLPSKPISLIDVELDYELPDLTEIIEVDQTEMFLDAIGFKESGNRYDIVNKFGYMGRYQFGRGTLRGLGYKLTQEEFLDSPEVQERAMIDLLKHNKKKLQKYIDKHEGDTIHGIYITESGVLAAAHLGGQGNVKKFFRRGKKFKDGFGTGITTYMEKFGGYELTLY